MEVILCNTTALIEHEQQREADLATWACGGVVVGDRGAPLTKNRHRPFKAEIARQDCHCG